MSDKKYRLSDYEKWWMMSSYDEILLGFPIWWYVALTIINTFLEAYDFSGKRLCFCNIRRKWIWNTGKELQSSAMDAVITEADC